MCSYCGCRNIPMIAKLNAEHDAIVNSTYALQVAFRDHDVESAKTAGKMLAELLHPHTRREQDRTVRRNEEGRIVHRAHRVTVRRTR